jgi:hypothetical protein
VLRPIVLGRIAALLRTSALLRIAGGTIGRLNSCILASRGRLDILRARRTQQHAAQHERPPSDRF